MNILSDWHKNIGINCVDNVLKYGLCVVVKMYVWVLDEETELCGNILLKNEGLGEPPGKGG